MILNMFRFIKRVLVIAMLFFSSNNQECKIRTEILSINSNKPLFYLYSVKISKCRGSCNNINHPYAKLYVPDVVKNMNIKVFNIMSRTNETRYMKWPETCMAQNV